MINTSAIERRRQDARDARNRDRRLAATIAQDATRAAIRETEGRTLAQRIAHARRSLSRASWSIAAHGSHR